MAIRRMQKKKGCKTCGNYTMMNAGSREKFGAIVKYNGNKENAIKGSKTCGNYIMANAGSRGNQSAISVTNLVTLPGL